MRGESWGIQDDALRQRDRQIEQHIKMLAGQQWIVFSPLANEYVDVAREMTDAERRWKKRPVINLLLPWFLLSHARMTENPPVLTFVPGPDAADAELAEVLDTAFKALWRELGMPDRWDEAAAWMLAAGRVHLQSRIDRNGGPMKKWVGPAELPVRHSDGSLMVDGAGNPFLQMVEEVPFDAEGQPLMHLTPEGPRILGEPHETREGRIVVELLTPLEVRGTWGPTPWHEKPVHMTRAYLPPEEVFDRWGVECDPDASGEASDGNAPYLRRLLFNAGYFGAAGGGVSEQLDSGSTRNAREGYCEVTTRWERPCPKYPEGRLSVVTPQKVLYDGVRPIAFPYTSGIRTFDFVRLPGRMQGSTPLEQMVPIQQAINRGWAQILQHRELATNPIHILDKRQGIKEFLSEPGSGYEVNRSNDGVLPIEWISPPQLSGDVYKTQQLLVDTLLDIAQLRGTEGAPPTDDASGELVKELRFNSDRHFGPSLRRVPEEMGRMAQDWRALLPIIWDTEKVISYAGEDNVVRVLTVLPHLWEQGHVDVVPDAESMLPEGRGERQARIYRMWADGMFGHPQSPGALKTYFDLARFPHLGRASRPGGPDRVMAERMLGEMLQGLPAEEAPWFPWYDELTHLDVFSTYMKSPAFLDQPPEIQRQLAMRWETLSQIAQEKAAAMAAAQIEQEGAMAEATGKPGKPGSAGKKAAPGGSKSTAPDRGADHAPAGMAGQYPTQ